MKKLIILIISLWVANAYAQFPVTQTLGNANGRTLVKSVGGFKADVGFINSTYIDTAAANTNPDIKKYPGAQIYTTSDNTVWYRNWIATGWVKYSAGASLSLTTTGTSGAATFNAGTGVLNIPAYAAGTGTVTSFSAGNLSPLFMSGITNPTTTPDLTFSPSSINQYEILGRKASGNGAYSFLTADSSLIPALHSENYYNTKYALAGSSGGISSLSAIGSTPNANGATITGSVLNLEPASASFGGVVINGAQVFGGVKTMTAPIFVTSAQVPLIIGGTGTTSTLIFKTTTGIGATGADHIFQVGNNGATEAMRILNSGFVGIGDIAPTVKLQVTGTSYANVLQTNGNIEVANGQVFSSDGFRSTAAGQQLYLFAHQNLYFSGNGNSGTGSASLKITGATGAVAISGNAGTTADASSLLDITSTTKGFLMPRMTKAQRDAIASAATGLMIYQTDNTPGLRVYNGTNWMRFTETID